MRPLDPMSSQIDVPLLRKTLEYAEAHPEEIDLGSWASRTSCGTTSCIAGTVCHLTGYEIDWESADGNGDVWVLTDGNSIEHVAQRELGLTTWQADRLFYRRSLSAVWDLAEELTHGEIQRPREVD